jgi:hypothetical protein
MIIPATIIAILMTFFGLNDPADLEKIGDAEIENAIEQIEELQGHGHDQFE